MKVKLTIGMLDQGLISPKIFGRGSLSNSRLLCSKFQSSPTALAALLVCAGRIESMHPSSVESTYHISKLLESQHMK